MKEILDWSEVWALFIPIVVFVVRRPVVPQLNYVVIYIFAALVINILVDVPWKLYSKGTFLEVVFSYNNLLYNLHSILRLFLFLLFFRHVNIPDGKLKQTLLFLFFFCSILLNFIFFDSIREFSSKVFTIESAALLICCINFFISELKKEEITSESGSVLIIIIGLAVYEAVCFFIFLFYETLSAEAEKFAIDLWHIHNVFYIILCLFIARAFYGRINYGQHH